MNRNEIQSKLALVENVQVADFELGSDCEISQGTANAILKINKGKANQKEFVLSEAAYKKAAAEIGMPQTYAEKTPRDLVTPHLNYWFNNKQGNLRILHKEGAVIDFVSPRITPISNSMILDIAQEVMGKDISFEDVTVGYDYTGYSILGPKATEPKKGDVVRGGVVIQNPLQGTVDIAGYLYRLVCQNGMVSAQSIFRYSRRHADISNVPEWVKGAIQEAHDKLEHEFNNVKKLQELSIQGYTADVLNDIFNEYGLAPSVRQEIMDQIVNGGGATMYDVWNAITWTASHSDQMKSHGAKRRLMSVAGDLISNKRVCDNCHSVISR